MLRIVFIVFLAYLGFIFPFAYFRHDDWLILGNSVLELPRDWLFTFRPSLFFDGREVDWFFRPMFKFSVYLFYQLFGYSYYLWLLALLGCFGGLLWLGYQIIVRLTEKPVLGAVFVAMLAGSVHLHFGSLVWMGEGIMNCPQAFFLFLSTYLFLVWTQDGKRSAFLFSIAAYLCALGFKESSVLHLAVLGLLLIYEKSFQQLSLKKRAMLLLPFAVITAGYLYYRLGVVPQNPHYAFRFRVPHMAKTIALFAVAIGFPAACWLWTVRRHWPTLARRVPGRIGYLALLGVSIAPYLGLPHIFSPGWMLLPGAYALLVLCLMSVDLPRNLPVFRPALFATFFAFVGVGMSLHNVGWWNWHQGQRQMKEIVASTPTDRYSELVIFNCPDPIYDRVHVQRVVGFKASLYQLWSLHHNKPVPVKILPCRYQNKITRDDRLKKLILRWDFPRFEPLVALNEVGGS